MKYYRINGNLFALKKEKPGAVEISQEEYEGEMEVIRSKAIVRDKAVEASRPLSESEVLGMLVKSQINSLDIPEETASRMVDYYPGLTGGGSLIKAGTRINWNGVLKQAAVDLWDTDGNTPDAAPALWSDIAYREGVRIIPETITASQAFALDEPGWWDGHIWRSTLEANVYTPAQYADGWEMVR